ncbi:MAG: metallophosphoesterase family protein [Actinomycetota bacterium]
MRIYYASDVHGSERLWRKFLNAASFYQADVLIMGGDLTGKVMVPFVERTPGVWTARILGKFEEIRGERELEDACKRVRLNGFYPLVCSQGDYESLTSDPQKRDRIFRGLMREELSRWVRLASDKLADSGVPCYVMPGNDDEWDIDAVLDAAPAPIENCEGKLVEIDRVQMISSAWTNPTPWDSPRELPEDELYDRLAKLVAEVDPDAPAIFNLHCPPHDSGIDRAPELTGDLRVVTEGGDPKMIPVGSRAVRRLIEEHQPLIALHGHIHEARGIAHIGRTLCINPGSMYGEGVLDGALIDIREGEVAAHQLVSG